MEKKKKRLGDRFDATWVRDADALHGFVPYLYPHRTDNEAFIRDTIDLGPINAFLEKKNEGLDKKHRYTIFHCIGCALVKVLTLRPKMNYFYQGSRLYSRDDISLAFVVKKYFADDAEEGLAYLKFPRDTTIDSYHERVMEEIFQCRRTDVKDNSSAGMEMMMKLPRFILRPLAFIFRRLDYFGKMPYSLIKTDPNYASVFMTNLGSIGLDAGYHHLYNWGTVSLFVVIGKKHMAPQFAPDGSVTMREVIDIGYTIDERIADGYYYSKSVALLRHILEHPELLDRPANEEVVF